METREFNKGDIQTQDEHVLWASCETARINYAPENDEQSVTRNAFSYGLIEARRVHGNVDNLDIKSQLRILKKVAEMKGEPQ